MHDLWVWFHSSFHNIIILYRDCIYILCRAWFSVWSFSFAHMTWIFSQRRSSTRRTSISLMSTILMNLCKASLSFDMSLPHVRQHTINCEDEDFHRPLQGDLGFDDKSWQYWYWKSNCLLHVFRLIYVFRDFNITIQFSRYKLITKLLTNKKLISIYNKLSCTFACYFLL